MNNIKQPYVDQDNIDLYDSSFGLQKNEFNKLYKIYLIIFLIILAVILALPLIILWMLIIKTRETICRILKIKE